MSEKAMEAKRLRILNLMKSRAYRDPGSKEHVAVSTTVREYFETNRDFADPTGLGASQSPAKASRTPDPTRRRGTT